MHTNTDHTQRFWRTAGAVMLYAIAMGFVEAAVVVYLRALYYPEGFTLPLRTMPAAMITVELFRELATLMMLGAVAMVAGRARWERFGWFLVAFGVWDIFYYVWLKATLDWPATLFDWDILFLIPVPWIGPVIAPVLVSIGMTVFGLLIARRVGAGLDFRAPLLSWLAAFLGSVVILISFLYDTPATLGQNLPRPYPYWMLALGLVLYIESFRRAWRAGGQPPR